MLQGNAIVGQSGGPTAVINASLLGIVEAAKEHTAIQRVLGMRFAIEGVLEDVLLDLTAQEPQTLADLRRTPSSALGSSRLKLADEHFPTILQTLKKHNIRYFFMIGGNDTMDTIHRVVDYANRQGYEMVGVGVCKTVDNDLPHTDHTPGFPSAARYVALSVQQGGILARDMQRVDQYTIYQTVGRSAGWLPAAAACAKQDEADAPHVILMPETPFDRDAFLAKVEHAHRQFGFCSIVCGEGITDAQGQPVSASQTRDKFGNVEFGAMGGTSAAMMLHQMIGQHFGWRGEFQVTESLQMAAADRAVPLDIEEAHACGREAVRLAAAGTNGVMVTLVRESNDPYRFSHGQVPLAEVANQDRPLPPEFISSDGMFITDDCLAYLRPLVGDMPTYAKLNLTPATA